jgi:hypothetical protein
MVLTTAAHLKAAQGEENFTINAQGGLTAKGLDQRNEKSISVVDWYMASVASEDHIREHFGEGRAAALTAHHKIVMDLGRSHNWDIAMEYDISQHEMVVLHPVHDLSTLDVAVLAIIVTCPSVKSVPQSFLSTSLSKCPLQDDHPTTPQKKLKHVCFQCGEAGHLLADCEANVTTAGKKPAPIISLSKSGNVLLAPNGKQFCLNWSQNSNCHFANTCTGFH